MANRTGIVEDISFLLFGDSEDHTADYSLKDVTRNVNRWYGTVSTKIRQADWRWKWDDNNASDLPIVDIDLVAGQAPIIPRSSASTSWTRRAMASISPATSRALPEGFLT